MIRGRIKHDETSIDVNGNITVFTEYTNSAGQVIQQGTTRYSFIVDGTVAEIRAKAEKDVEDHAKALMTRTYAKNRNSSELNAIKAELAKVPVKEVSEATLVQNGKLVTVDESGIKGIIEA